MYKTKNKRNKKYKKTRKYYGGDVDVDVPNTYNDFQPSEGIFDILGDKISNFTNNAYDYIEKKTLKAAGLEKINGSETNTNNNNIIEDGINKASGVVSNTINNVTNKLKSPETQQIVTGAAQNLAVTDAAQDLLETGTKLLNNFNQVASTPAFKQALTIASDNLADTSEIVLEAMDEPINEAMNKFIESGSAAASGIIQASPKVITDGLAGIPGVGAFIEMGKIMNDSTAALGDVVEAWSDASEALSKAVGETSINIDKGFDNLEKEKQKIKKLSNLTLTNPNLSLVVPKIYKPLPNAVKNINNATNNATKMKPTIKPSTRNNAKQLAQTGGLKKIANDKEQIGGRINDSLSEFSDPIGYQTGILKEGHNKTKKVMVNGNDRKSRRVRFFI